jgi:alpha-ketoglutarate-dependent 2,4-dichlorophenoxyacetate dioxygenase
MSVSVRPLHPLFVGEVSGVDLREPLPAADIAAIHAGMNRHGLLVFHNQSMSPDQQREMTRQFGTLELGFAKVAGRHRDWAAQPPRTGYAEVADMSNLGALIRGRCANCCTSELTRAVYSE